MFSSARGTSFSFAMMILHIRLCFSHWATSTTQLLFFLRKGLHKVMQKWVKLNYSIILLYIHYPQICFFLLTNSISIIKEQINTKNQTTSKEISKLLKIPFIIAVGGHTETGKEETDLGEVFWILTLTLGWVGKVPLAFMVLTSLLNAVISPSFLSCWLLVTVLSVSSKCSAMKGVEFFICWSTFKPLSPASTSSTESTTPECAEKLRKLWLHQAKGYYW